MCFVFGIQAEPTLSNTPKGEDVKEQHLSEQNGHTVQILKSVKLTT
jgi:hypothetical protein